MTTSVHERAVRVPLYRTAIVSVGEFRCPIDNPMFTHSGPARCHCFCFPRTSVWIRHEGQPSFVADPNTVTFYNRGELYWRSPLSRAGDLTDWFGVTPEVIRDTIGRWDDAAADRENDVFPFTHGPSGPATYLLQRSLFEHVREHSSPDALFVEETVIELLHQVAGLAYERAGTRRFVSAALRRRRRDLCENARSLLAMRYVEPLSLADLAAMLDSSVFHLARTFRQEIGSSLHAYRNHLRLRAALERLGDGHADLLSIALDLGYCSHSHFAETFRRTFGVPPSRARRGLQAARSQSLHAVVNRES
jgi:AraC-like DNA-binding protein